MQDAKVFEEKAVASKIVDTYASLETVTRPKVNRGHVAG